MVGAFVSVVTGAGAGVGLLLGLLSSSSSDEQPEKISAEANNNDVKAKIAFVFFIKTSFLVIFLFPVYCFAVYFPFTAVKASPVVKAAV